MYDPVTKAPFPTASTVTVSQTTNLTNQMVNVSWTGFTPTNGRGVPGYVPAISMYPVMVTECQGTAPTSLAPATEPPGRSSTGIRRLRPV